MLTDFWIWNTCLWYTGLNVLIKCLQDIVGRHLPYWGGSWAAPCQRLIGCSLLMMTHSSGCYFFNAPYNLNFMPPVSLKKCVFRPAYPGCGGCCVAMSQRKRWVWGRDMATAWFTTDTATPREEEGEAETGMCLCCQSWGEHMFGAVQTRFSVLCA